VVKAIAGHCTSLKSLNLNWYSLPFSSFLLSSLLFFSSSSLLSPFVYCKIQGRDYNRVKYFEFMSINYRVDVSQTKEVHGD
jgi:hypothetical protein